jgi:hypothetical protein
MGPFVLFCKSYRDDVLRVKRLTETIQQHNLDHIPFYISVPTADFPIFQEQLRDFDYILLADEDILAANPRHSLALMTEMPGSLLQQVVKSEFWRLKVCMHYLMIDSDSYFIRDFSLSDFMFDEETPYTVMHESKDILEFAARSGIRKIRENYVHDRQHGQQYFNRSGRIFDFGPTPIICSSLVWRSLAMQFAEPRNLSFADMIKEYPNEMIWYGEALLQYQSIRLIPVGPLFKVFHYKEQYVESIERGETEAVIAENYLGIIKQSNWDESFDLSRRKKRSWKTLWFKR